MRKALIKRYIILAVVLLICSAAFTIYKNTHYLNRLCCAYYGHDWERYYSDSWIWHYNYDGKGEDFQNGYKYRYKPNYAKCKRDGAYLFNVSVVEVEIYKIEQSEIENAKEEMLVDSANRDKLVRKWSYKDGKLHGLCLEYYRNGRQKSQWYCKNDKMHGEAKFFNLNGSPLWQGNYVNGKLHGMSREFYEDASFKRTDNYRYGKAHGLSRLFYRNGQVKWERDYKDGKRDGITKEYYENGKLSKDGLFEDNLGTAKEYYQDGSLKSETLVEGGKVTYIKRFDSEGNLVLMQKSK